MFSTWRALIVGLAIAVVALPAAVIGAGDDPDTESIRIGLEGPLSGDQSAVGDGMLKGARLAAAHLNDAGGLLGREVEVVPIDDAADPATGTTAAAAAIEAGLDGLVGPYNSSVGIVTLPMYIDAGIVPVRLTSDASTSGLGYTLQPMTYQIVPVVTTALTDWLEAGSVAIVYDATQNYSTTIGQTLRTGLEAAGVDVVAFEPIEPGLDDYSELVSRITSLEPDAVYAAAYVPEGGRFAKAMHESGSPAACLGDYATYETSYIDYAGLEAARACPLAGVPAPDDFPGSDELVRAYEKMFGSAPGVWSPYAYDSLMLLAAGIAAAGSLDAEAVGGALEGLEGWRGWTGDVRIDPTSGDRDPATVVIVSVDEAGEFHVDPDWASAVDAPFHR